MHSFLVSKICLQIFGKKTLGKRWFPQDTANSFAENRRSAQAGQKPPLDAHHSWTPGTRGFPHPKISWAEESVFIWDLLAKIYKQIFFGARQNSALGKLGSYANEGGPTRTDLTRFSPDLSFSALSEYALYLRKHIISRDFDRISTGS